MKKVKLLMIVAVASLFTITGCTKEGEQGITGTNGIDGTDGNANVQSLTLVANSTSNWTWDSGNSWREASWTGAYPLTASAVSTGAVMLYQEDGSGGYFPLPVTIKYSGITENDWFTYGFERVSIVVQNLDNSDPIAQIPIPTRYKLVVIPSSARLANPNVDMMDYNQVKEMYNLED